VATILFVISATGIATLAPTAAAQIGPVGLGQVTTGSWGYMLLAGSFNAVGFFALGKSLKLISVVHANVINASQVAIAAVSGIVLFGEPGSWPLLLGVAIAIVGLVVVREPTPATAAET
jgi:drug/metabolite transporter (DMT)-like permease